MSETDHDGTLSEGRDAGVEDYLGGAAGTVVVVGGLGMLGYLIYKAEKGGEGGKPAPKRRAPRRAPTGALNAQSGLYTLEVVGGLGLLGYLIYKWETSNPLDWWEEYEQEQEEEEAAAAVIKHYRDILARGVPIAGSGQGAWDEYTAACRYIVANPTGFTGDEIGQANSWLAYIATLSVTDPLPEETEQSPSEMMDNTVAAIVNGPYPDGTTNHYARNFTTACIIVLEPDQQSSYNPAVVERAGRWYHWLQFPNTPKPVGSATDPNAREADLNTDPVVAENSRIVRGRYPSNNDLSDSYRNRFTQACLDVGATPADYQTDVKARAQKWVYWLLHQDTPMPTDPYHGAGPRAVEHHQSKMVAPGFVSKGGVPKGLYDVRRVGPTVKQCGGFAGYTPQVRPSFQANDGFSRRLYTV